MLVCEAIRVTQNWRVSQAVKASLCLKNTAYQPYRAGVIQFLLFQ